MNKSMVYKILYYTIFLFTIVMCFFTKSKIDVYMVTLETLSNMLLVIINLILIVIFSIKIKNKLGNINLLFPIIHIIFMVLVFILSLSMNNKLLFPYMHFTYYISFILFNYLLLNIYSILSFVKLKK